MAAFLAGKLARENNGRVWEKEAGICCKEGKESWAKVQKHPSFLSRTWGNILKQGETSTGAMVVSS